MPLKFLNSKYTYYTLMFGLVVISGLLLIQTFNRALRLPYGNDFTLFLDSSINFFRQKNPYIKEGNFEFLYPQTLCVLIYPLTLLNYKISILVWFFLNFGALALAFHYFINIIDKNRQVNKEYLFSIVFIALFAIMQDNFLNGQVNFIVLFLCILFFKFFLQSKKLYSSIFLALAISIKVTPMIFLVFLLASKDYKTIILTILFSIFLILFIPIILTNSEFVMSNYKYYLETFILHRTTNFSSSNLHAGFSLTRILGIYFGKYSLIISATLSLGLLFISQFRKTNISPILFSGYLLCILLIAPMSEKHHLILALPLILLLITIRNYFTLNLIIIAIFIFASSIKENVYLTLFSVILLYIGLVANYLIKPYKKINYNNFNLHNQ